MSRGKKTILVSACLLGVMCRYDGSGNLQEKVASLRDRFQLLPICPEQLGGMMTPREPAEQVQADCIQNQEKSDQMENAIFVKSRLGEDVTAQYARGAGEALRLAEFFDCRYAIMKERSPSCGKGQIYDGTFTGTKITGSGVTVQLLESEGIAVFGESQVEELLLAIQSEEQCVLEKR